MGEIYQDWQKGQLPRSILLYGPENYEKNRAWQQLVNKILKPEEYQWALTRLEGNATTAQEIITCMKATPFGLSTGIILVSGVDELELTEQEELAGALADFPAGNYLIMLAQKLDKGRKLFKAIAKQGKAYEFPNLAGKELLRWIQTKAVQMGLKLPAGLAEIILEMVGNDLGTIHMELEKLVTYANGELITKAEGKNVLFPTVVPGDDRLIFQLSDAVGMGQRSAALEHLDKLFQMGMEPLQILGMLSRQFRLMSQAHGVGLKPEMLTKECGVHAYVAKKVCQQARNYQRNELTRIWHQLLETDGQLKGGISPRLSLEMLLVKLTHKKTPR